MTKSCRVLCNFVFIATSLDDIRFAKNFQAVSSTSLLEFLETIIWLPKTEIVPKNIK